MTNYEIIKRYLEFGFKVKCQREDGFWKVYSSIMSGGGLRHTCFNNTVDICFNYLGDSCEPEKETNEMKFLSITPIIEKPKMYQVGDLVDIAEEAKVKFLKSHLSGWQITEIEDEESGLNYEVTKDTERLWISHYYLTPHIPEQDDEVAKSITEAVKMLSSCEGDDAYTIETLPKVIKILKSLKFVK